MRLLPSLLIIAAFTVASFLIGQATGGYMQPAWPL